ncbi:ferrochelatase [Gorillibacterium sp. sgz500922]|uniref:ferrochelatase n=1 Tax=Gorillibacterium sp. sgz500922 TaxID=3446694 RepID=UPI003F661C52
MESQQIGVVLAQIGTPEAPEARAVRPYLAKFLSDRRIIDYPAYLWKLLLHGIILRVRPKRSAALYREIWTEQGSPLMRISAKQRDGLQERLGEGFRVELGLAYSEPGIASAIQRLEEAGIRRIVVLPLFPQYSSTTTAVMYDKACFAALGRSRANGPAPKRFVPELRLIGSYHNRYGYIRAMCGLLSEMLDRLPQKPDHYVLTYHGIPARYAMTGDPYPGECEETSRLLASEMGWEPEEWTLAYQSRFGPETWLGPSVTEVLERLAGEGIRRPLVFSPGLVTDCLETLHELGIEARGEYAGHGGDSAGFVLCPCLNDHPDWLDFLAELVRAHSLGWEEPDDHPLALTRILRS